MAKSFHELDFQQQNIYKKFLKITNCPENMVLDILTRNYFDLKSSVYEYANAYDPEHMNNYINQLNRSASNKFVTLNDDDNDPKDDKNQSYYVSNSGTSGQNVLPNLKNKKYLNDDGSDDDEFMDLTNVTSDQTKSVERKKKEDWETFRNIAKTSKLDKELPFIYSNMKKSLDSQAENMDPEDKDIDTFEITLYQNGLYIVSMDEFIDKKHPDFVSIMNPISRGVVPDIIRKKIGNKEAKIMLNAVPVDYDPPKYRAFKGKASMLGNVVPDFVDSSALKVSDAVIANQNQVEYQIQVDDSIKVSMLRLRLMDGSVKTLRINPTVHTLKNLIDHISGLNQNNVAFRLYEGHPPKKIIMENNLDRTLLELKLENTIIIQRPT